MSSDWLPDGADNDTDTDTGWVLGGRYRLIAQVGIGGMAVVWRAHDDVLARTVAVKVLATHAAEDPRSRDRIRREAQAAAALSHPNIAQVYDYGEADVDGEITPYVVMELIRGDSLQQRLIDGPMLARNAMRLCAEIAAALSAAHTEGLVHRDIKPANIMLAPTGAKVVDFGIAAAIRPPGSGADENFEVLGTPAYLAPERLLHDAVQPASDVYALGVLLYRLLAGHSPWTSETTTQMLSAHVYVEPTPLLPMFQVPDYVTALCNRCLAKDPTQRPSAREAAALLAHGAGLQVVTDEPPGPERAAAIDLSPSVLIRASGGAGSPPSGAAAPAVRQRPAQPGDAPEQPSPPDGPSPAVRQPAPPGPNGVPLGMARSAPPASDGALPATVSPARPSPDDGPPGMPAERSPAGARPTAAGPSSPGSGTDSGRPGADADSRSAVGAGAGTGSGPSGSGARSGADSAAGAKASAAGVRRKRRVYALVAVVLLAAVAATLWLLPLGREKAPVSAPAPGVGPTATASQAAVNPLPGASRPPGNAPRPTGLTNTAPANSTLSQGAPPGPAGEEPAATVPTPVTPGPEPTATTTTSPPEPVERTLSSDAGSVRATCPATDTAQILSWTATKPYKVVEGDKEAGSAPAVSFKHGNRLLTMTVTCSRGVPSATST